MHKILLISMCLLLTGCNLINGEDSYFRNRGKDYRGAYLIEPLDVPVNISMPDNSEMYPVPSELPVGDTSVNLEPPEFAQGEVI